MPFPLFQSFGKVIALRRKRSTKIGRPHHNSTTTHHEGESFIPAAVYPISATREPDLEVSTNMVSARHPWGTSPAREASDIAQLVFPLVQAVAGPIPLVGAPIQAAIGGLLTILQVIDRRDQNKADLDDLTSRLYELYSHLCNAPLARNPLEQSRRDLLARKLQGTSDKLTKLQKHRLAYTSVTKAIAGCSTDIDRYLLQYLWSGQMQSHNDMHDLRQLMIHEQSSVGPSSSQSTRTVSVAGCVILVDAAGHHHPISVSFCTSFQQLNLMLRVLFERDSPEAHIQRRYIEEGQYDLCIDEGTQVTQLTSQEWSSIEAGTKIVMRVLIQQDTELSDFEYQCHFCSAINRLGDGYVTDSFRRRAGCSIDCRVCKRRFQISRRDMGKQSTHSSNDESDLTMDAEMHLIRNFHVQQRVKILVRDFGL